MNPSIRFTATYTDSPNTLDTATRGVMLTAIRTISQIDSPLKRPSCGTSYGLRQGNTFRQINREKEAVC